MAAPNMPNPFFADIVVVFLENAYDERDHHHHLLRSSLKKDH